MKCHMKKYRMLRTRGLFRAGNSRNEPVDNSALVAFCAVTLVMCCLGIALMWGLALYIVTAVTLSNTPRDSVQVVCPGSMMYDYLVTCMCLTLLPVTTNVIYCTLDPEGRRYKLARRFALGLWICSMCGLVVYGLSELAGRSCSDNLSGWRMFTVSAIWVATELVAMIVVVVYCIWGK